MIRAKITRQKIFAFLRWLFIVSTLTLVLLETALQIAALFVDKRQNILVPPSLLLDRKLRVVMMGDSNTYGLYLKEEESYPAVFQAVWNKHHPDNKMEVINLGFPGTNSSRILKNLPNVIKTFSPDVITVMVGINDFWVPPVNVDGITSPVSPIEGWLRDHSRVYKLIYMLRRQSYNQDQLIVDDKFRKKTFSEDERQKFIASLSGERKFISQDNPPPIRYGNNIFDISYILDAKGVQKPAIALGENMSRIADIAEASSIKLIFITYAYFEGPQRVANQQMKDIAKKRKIPLINVTKIFRKNCALSEERCKELFFSDSHPKAEGYRLLASEIEKYFLNFDHTPDNF